MSRMNIKGIDRLDEYKVTVARMAAGESKFTGAVYARWLLSFSKKRLEGSSPKAWREVQTEALVFRCGGRSHENLQDAETVCVRPLPSPAQVTQAQQFLQTLIERLQKGKRVDIKTDNWIGTVQQVKGRLWLWSNPLQLPWLDAFKMRVYETLTDPKVKSHFRFCLNEGCGRPFLASKRQVYCSTSCSQHHRTLLYRNKDRARFNEKRREYYEKKQREITGLPNLRIQTRKGTKP